MEEVLQADVFFFVTTIAVAVFTIFSIIVGIYLVRILREVDHIARVARKEADEVAEDIQEVSEEIKESVEQVHHDMSHGIGGIIALLLETIRGVRKQRSVRKRTRAKKRT